jgi:DNA integrity scanning protein DisA with diadenylate cyclase activity
MYFNKKYFFLTCFLFITEVIIATSLKNIVWIRAFFGDVLVVILLYTFIKTFFKFKTKKQNLYLLLGIFIFSCVIEFAQFFKFAELLGFKDNKLMMIVLGNSFSWLDILCYFIGCFFVLIIRNFKFIKGS